MHASKRLGILFPNQENAFGLDPIITSVVAAQRFEISDVKAAGTVLRAKDLRFEGEFVFRGVRQSGSQQSSGEPEKH